MDLDRGCSTPRAMEKQQVHWKLEMLWGHVGTLATQNATITGNIRDTIDVLNNADIACTRETHWTLWAL